ncbi:hypothetical protein [Frankia tisae]|uniref:hypothetical protein n=1 Tax=Frankia tisae TaxID=2950104 RepID=UPI0021BF3C4F|nr:hypothetical protein [Frankia tisae]
MTGPLPPVGPAIRRLGLAVRRVGDGAMVRGRVSSEIERGAVVLGLLEAAMRAAGLTALHISRQVEPDGAVVLLAVGMDEPGMIGRLAHFLRIATRRLNIRRPPQHRIMVRIAVDEGLAMLAGERFVGEVVDSVRRLCGGAVQPRPRAGDAPGPNPDGDVEVLVSPRIYHDLRVHDRWRAAGPRRADPDGRDLRIHADRFRPVRVLLHDGRTVAAWAW